MNYRRLGKTELMVSEIGLGGEWLERHNAEECKAVIKRCEDVGINILDCWMCDPEVRSKIGDAIEGSREKWIVQGHFGSTWQGGQYVRTRKLPEVKAAFEDMLKRFKTDYIDLGMIHYVDDPEEWDSLIGSDFLDYVFEMKANGTVRHIGMSTHNPAVAKKAVESGFVEMILFSVNPAFDLLPAVGDIDNYFKAETFEGDFGGIAPERAELYRLCEQNDIGITVMKGFAGGRLFSAETSPFGVALTAVQCIHYALTRPAVASILVGVDDTEQVDTAIAYETASQEEKDYATVLAGAPSHAYAGECTYCGHCRPCPMNIDIAMVNKLYDLAVMQPELPASLREHYRALESTASACIGCGGCESRCPFGVPVAERMEKAAALFGE